MFETNTDSDNRYITYNKDGLVDVFIGLGIFFAGLFLMAELVWMVAIFIPTFLPAFQAARKGYLEPRIGQLDDNHQRQTQSQKITQSITMLMGGLLFAGIVLFYAFGIMAGPLNDWLRQYFLLILGVVFASVWICAAVLMKLSRFFIHALLTFIPLAIVQITSLPFWAALSITGGLITIVGIIVFAQFLQNNPVEN